MTQMVTSIPVSELVVGDRLVLSHGLDEVVLSFREACEYFDVETMSEAGPVRRRFQFKTSLCGIRPRIQDVTVPTRFERDVL